MMTEGKKAELHNRKEPTKRRGSDLLKVGNFLNKPKKESRYQKCV